jgi:hypothetical protein
VGDVIHDLQRIAYVLLSLRKAKMLRAVKVFGKQTRCERGPDMPHVLTGWPELPGGVCSHAKLASAYSVSCLPAPARSRFLLISLTLSIVSSGMANPCLACSQAHLDHNTDLYFLELVPQHLMHWLSSTHSSAASTLLWAECLHAGAVAVPNANFARAMSQERSLVP